MGRQATAGACAVSVAGAWRPWMVYVTDAPRWTGGETPRKATDTALRLHAATEAMAGPPEFCRRYSPNSGALSTGALLAKVEGSARRTFCEPLLHSIQPGSETLPPPTTIHHSPSPATCHIFGRTDEKDPVSVRKLQKADREKLRRDRLNEHFLELAGALDADRPKNDKATIIGESIQILRELNSEVSRLRAEHDSLVSESHDLIQEKNELHDEKELLKSEAEQLRNQVDQHIHTHLPWMAMDSSMMMGLAAFPYPLQVPHSSSISSESLQPAGNGQIQRPFVAPNPYIPVPVPPNSLALYPGLQGYYRLGDGSNMFYPYLPYTPSVNSTSHVDRPFAQYPKVVQPLPGYSVQNHITQGRSLPSFVPGSDYSCSDTPGTANVPIRYQGKSPKRQENSCTGMIGENIHKDNQHDITETPTNALDGPYQDENSCQDVQLTLQLKTFGLFPPAPAQSSGNSAKLNEVQHDSNFILGEEEKQQSTEPCNSVSEPVTS